MSEDLNLTVWLVQFDTFWEDPVSNRNHLEELLATREGKPDLIVLPEMFTTGFSINTPNIETINLQSHNWMKIISNRINAVVVGSIPIKENKKIYNRLLWVEPDGSTQFYDKRHTFRMAQENEKFSSGTKKLIVKLKGWNICPMICYDLRFPVWSRNVDLEYDVLLYVANWPEKRIKAWEVLLQARAIENLSYCIGINRVGVDGLGIEYNGQSGVYGPKGETLLDCGEGEDIFEIKLKKDDLENFRTKFPSYLDNDTFLVTEKE